MLHDAKICKSRASLHHSADLFDPLYMLKLAFRNSIFKGISGEKVDLVLNTRLIHMNVVICVKSYKILKKNPKR